MTTTPTAPRFTLPDGQGRPVSLEDHLGHGPVVLVFYRGDWCAYCNGQLASFVQHRAALARFDARVLAISVDSGPDANDLQRKLTLPFQVLSDPEHRVIDRYAGIEEGTRNGVAIGKPATYLIDRDGYIVWSYVGFDFADRPLIAEVLAQVERAATGG